MNDNTTQDRLRKILKLYSTKVQQGEAASGLDEALAAINLEFDGVIGNDGTHNRLHHRVIDNGCTAECGAGIANELRAKQRQAWYGTTNPNGDNS